jgi:phosphoribosylglycinamide formyltransferase-1
MDVGLITYHYPHLKTEQVLERILNKGFKYTMYALPFKYRKKRKPIFDHRPNQFTSILPEILAEKHKIPYVICNSDLDIKDGHDIYLVLGAGILSSQCVANKRIINCHPGIIPACRGLDAFKWAIYEMRPLGITLHYIDAEVDAGEIIYVSPTNVYKTDNLLTLSRRHYENEIDCMSRFDKLMENHHNSFKDIEQGEARMRMPWYKEGELSKILIEYRKKYGK